MPRLSKKDVVVSADESAEPQQRVLSERLAQLIHNSPAVRDVAVEVGVIDRQWLDEPSLRQPSIARRSRCCAGSWSAPSSATRPHLRVSA